MKPLEAMPIRKAFVIQMVKKEKKNDPNQHQVQLRTFIVFRGPCVKV